MGWDDGDSLYFWNVLSKVVSAWSMILNPSNSSSLLMTSGGLVKNEDHLLRVNNPPARRSPRSCVMAGWAGPLYCMYGSPVDR